MATAAIGFLGGNLVRRQQKQGLFDRKSSNSRVHCSSNNKDGGDEIEEVDMAKLLGLVLQSDESKALFKDLDAAVQRVEDAKRELDRIDELKQQNKKNAAGKFDQFKTQQEILIEECEKELAAAKAEARAAEFAMAAAAAADSSTLNEAAERIESGKAALVSAATGVLVSLPFILADSDTGSLGRSFLGESFVLVSCATFGVCYRYILRKDLDNVQLKAGSAAAFALARGLGQADTLQKFVGLDQVFAGAVTYAGQSLVIFLSAAAVLDLCYRRKLLKPFSS